MVTLTANIENLSVTIFMHGRSYGYFLRQGQSFSIPQAVWDEQVIAQQMVEDNLLIKV